MINIEKIPLRSILLDIGFTKGVVDLEFDFGNCVVTACEEMFLYRAFFFMGNYRTERSLFSIEFKCPNRVDSFEQGIALLAHYFRRYKFDYEPSWLLEGAKLYDHLPWILEQAELQRAEAKRLEYQVKIDYDWFKLMVKKLRSWLVLLPTTGYIDFTFDGELLRVEAGGETIIIQGKGKPWNNKASLQISELSNLPKRIMINNSNVILYNDILYLAGNRFTNMDYGSVN